MGIRVIIQEKRGKDVKVQAKKNTQAMGFACLALGLLFFQCPGLDSNQHDRRSPPPQDGVSTNFTTWAADYPILQSGHKDKYFNEMFT